MTCDSGRSAPGLKSGRRRRVGETSAIGHAPFSCCSGVSLTKHHDCHVFARMAGSAGHPGNFPATFSPLPPGSPSSNVQRLDTRLGDPSGLQAPEAHCTQLTSLQLQKSRGPHESRQFSCDHVILPRLSEKAQTHADARRRTQTQTKPKLTSERRPISMPRVYEELVCICMCVCVCVCVRWLAGCLMHPFPTASSLVLRRSPVTALYKKTAQFKAPSYHDICVLTLQCILKFSFFSPFLFPPLSLSLLLSLALAGCGEVR